MVLNGKDAQINRILPADRPIHSWYHFVLGYPPHLVRQYIRKFGLGERDLVLDPFCGTSTTNVECMMSHIPSIGIDANPVVRLAARVKTRWDLDPTELMETFGYIYHSSLKSLKMVKLGNGMRPLVSPPKPDMTFVIRNVPALTDEEYELIPKNFISPRPLRKVLILRDVIRTIEDPAIRDFFLLALVEILVGKAANIAFGPAVYATTPKKDVDLLRHYLAQCYQMIKDVSQHRGNTTPATIMEGDARDIGTILGTEYHERITGVITSPPYPNEKDYTVATRLENVILGFLTTKGAVRSLRESLMKSNSRTVFKGDTDGTYIDEFTEITALADKIEQKRINLGKTSGFEKAYHRVVRQYFGGMYLHFENLKPYLATGARLAYVVGDQNSFFRVHIPTARHLADIATHLGFTVTGIDLWRKRFATATQKYVNEHVVLLKNG